MSSTDKVVEDVVDVFDDVHHFAEMSCCNKGQQMDNFSNNLSNNIDINFQCFNCDPQGKLSNQYNFLDQPVSSKCSQLKLN